MCALRGYAEWRVACRLLAKLRVGSLLRCSGGRSRQAQRERLQREALDFSGPEIAFVGWMAGGEGAGADDFAHTQGLGGESTHDGCAEFGQTQGGASQTVFTGSFLYKLSVLRHAHFE